MKNEILGTVLSTFEANREPGKQGWDLTWYLASEICDRFYASHGIVPAVIEHEGLGYYGIQLDRVKCPVNGPDEKTIGRFTMHGDVENWLKNGPGGHGLKLADRAARGEPVQPMVTEAIEHLGLKPFPEESHIQCRHHRWGASYCLVFRLCAMIAIRNKGRVSIWNHEFHTKEIAEERDPKFKQRQHPGHFLLDASESRVFIAGDGRVIFPDGQISLWERYMSGESESGLVSAIERWLGL